MCVYILFGIKICFYKIPVAKNRCNIGAELLVHMPSLDTEEKAEGGERLACS